MPIKVESKEIDGETWFKFNDKFDQTKYFYGNILTVLLIIVLVTLGSTLFYYMYSNVQELKGNPFIYAANRIRGDVSCSCIEFRNDQMFNFEFNKSTWWNSRDPTTPFYWEWFNLTNFTS